MRSSGSLPKASSRRSTKLSKVLFAVPILPRSSSSMSIPSFIFRKSLLNGFAQIYAASSLPISLFCSAVALRPNPTNSEFPTMRKSTLIELPPQELPTPVKSLAFRSSPVERFLATLPSPSCGAPLTISGANVPLPHALMLMPSAANTAPAAIAPIRVKITNFFIVPPHSFGNETTNGCLTHPLKL